MGSCNKSLSLFTKSYNKKRRFFSKMNWFFCLLLIAFDVSTSDTIDGSMISEGSSENFLRNPKFLFTTVSSTSSSYTSTTTITVTNTGTCYSLDAAATACTTARRRRRSANGWNVVETNQPE